MVVPTSLSTRSGSIHWPAYIPVTTFGTKYPLDDLIRPYLPRLAQAVMVSYYYARQMKTPPRLPLMVDSGGFVSLFEYAQIEKKKDIGIIKVKSEKGVEIVHPAQVLELQEQIADIAFTLDFPIPPAMETRAATKSL